MHTLSQKNYSIILELKKTSNLSFNSKKIQINVIYEMCFSIPHIYMNKVYCRNYVAIYLYIYCLYINKSVCPFFIFLSMTIKCFKGRVYKIYEHILCNHIKNTKILLDSWRHFFSKCFMTKLGALEFFFLRSH